MKVLFVWAENAGRSQMAKDFANKYEKNSFIVSTAAINPLKGVALGCLIEGKKISISNELSKTAEFSNSAKADLIVAM